MSRGINFIKNIGQLITGGIGIVDGALVYKDEQGDVRNPKGYKELSGVILASDTQINSNTIVVDDFGDVTVNLVSPGVIRFESNSFSSTASKNHILANGIDGAVTLLKCAGSSFVKGMDILFETTEEESYVINYTIKVAYD